MEVNRGSRSLIILHWWYSNRGKIAVNIAAISGQLGKLLLVGDWELIINNRALFNLSPR